MDDELTRLMDRIASLSDSQLLDIVHHDPGAYRPEAVVYARAELNRRGNAPVPEALVPIPMPLASIANFARWLVRQARIHAFTIGFVVGLLPFVWANYISYLASQTPGCYDCFVFWGYPVNLHQAGGFAGPDTILWPGLIVDAALAAAAALPFGWLFSLLVGSRAARRTAGL